MIDAQRARGLGHEDADQLLLRINPEVGARETTPHVLAGRSGGPREARLPPDGEAEAEGVARRPEEQFAGRERRVELAQVIRGHEGHGAAAQHAHSVEPATVEQHLGEAEVVGGGGDPARATGIVIRPGRHVDEPDRVARRWIGWSRLGQPGELVRRDEEA